MEPIRVLLIDDARIVVEGIHAILDRVAAIEVVGEATTPDEALEALRTLTPDVAVTDAVVRGTSGAQLARLMKARLPSVRVLVLSTRTDEDTLAKMIQAGADALIPKSVSSGELTLSIRQVAGGQIVYPAAAKKLFGQGLPVAPEPPPPTPLTGREREVLQLITLGATSREIARELGLSPKTIDNHRARILEKLQVRNNAEAVAYAIRGGFVEAEALDSRRRVVQLLPTPGDSPAEGRGESANWLPPRPRPGAASDGPRHPAARAANGAPAAETR